MGYEVIQGPLQNAITHLQHAINRYNQTGDTSNGSAMLTVVDDLEWPFKEIYKLEAAENIAKVQADAVAARAKANANPGNAWYAYVADESERTAAALAAKDVTQMANDAWQSILETVTESQYPARHFIELGWGPPRTSKYQRSVIIGGKRVVKTTYVTEPTLIQKALDGYVSTGLGNETDSDEIIGQVRQEVCRIAGVTL